MGESAIERGVRLIFRYRLGGYAPENCNKRPMLLHHFEQTSRLCRQVFDGVCARCPDCECASIALERTNADFEPVYIDRPVPRRQVPPTPPRGPEPPPRKRPAMTLPKPRVAQRTNVVARELEHLRRILRFN